MHALSTRTRQHVCVVRAGLAAGFDKDAEAIEGLMGVGFGFVEVGESGSSTTTASDQLRMRVSKALCGAEANMTTQASQQPYRTTFQVRSVGRVSQDHATVYGASRCRCYNDCPSFQEPLIKPCHCFESGCPLHAVA